MTHLTKVTCCVLALLLLVTTCAFSATALNQGDILLYNDSNIFVAQMDSNDVTAQSTLSTDSDKYVHVKFPTTGAQQYQIQFDSTKLDKATIDKDGGYLTIYIKCVSSYKDSGCSTIGCGELIVRQGLNDLYGYHDNYMSVGGTKTATIDMREYDYTAGPLQIIYQNYNWQGMYGVELAFKLASASTAAASVRPMDEPYENTNDSIYCKYKDLYFGKTEGWFAGAKNIDTFFFEDHTEVTDAGMHLIIDEGEMKSQQVNFVYMTNNVEHRTAQAAFEECKAGTKYLYFSVKLNSAIDTDGKSVTAGLKYSIAGAVVGDDNIIRLFPGQQKTFLVDITEGSSAWDSGVNFWIKNFDEDLADNAAWNKGLIGIDIEFTPIRVYTGAAPTPTQPTPTQPTQPQVDPTQPSGDITYGDVNDDGKVNGKDSMTLKQYNAQMLTDADINMPAADVNVDGKINGKDSMVLKQFNAQLIDSLPYQG